jgi:hypothetical protein
MILEVKQEASRHSAFCQPDKEFEKATLSELNYTLSEISKKLEQAKILIY